MEYEDLYSGYSEWRDWAYSDDELFDELNLFEEDSEDE